MINLVIPEALVEPYLRHHSSINVFRSSALVPLKLATSSAPSLTVFTTFSRTTALNNSSLLGKYKNRVPLETPALAATSSDLVAANPFSTNKSSAASSNSPGRCCLRRSLLGVRRDSDTFNDSLVSNVSRRDGGVKVPSRFQLKKRPLKRSFESCLRCIKVQ